MKTRLLTPGPTPVPERVALAMAQPILHHRSPQFEEIFARVREGLRWLFGTRQEVLTFCSSGTGAMEGAVTNFLRRGDKAVVVDGGKFGERWWKICKAYGVEPVIVKVEWGRAVDPAEVKKALDGSGARALYVQANESSTGVMHPIAELARLTRDGDRLFVVDAISALGAFPIPMDELGIDVLLTGSQKALGLPPGLAFAGVSEKAWRFAETSDLPRFYFQWKKELESQKKNQTVYTPAVSLILGLDEALKMFREEGLERVYARHARMARMARAAAAAMGLNLYSHAPSNAMTVVCAPEGVDGEKVVKRAWQQYGVRFVGGQDQAKGKIVRIAHLGHFDELDIVVAIAALEQALADLGYPAALGKGVAAAQLAMRAGEGT